MSAPNKITVDSIDSLYSLQSELHKLLRIAELYQIDLLVLKQQVDHSELVVDQYNSRNCNDYFGFMRRMNKELEVRLIAMHKDLSLLKGKHKSIGDSLSLTNGNDQGNVINFVKLNGSTNQPKLELQLNSLFSKMDVNLDELKEVQTSIVNKTNLIIAKMRDQKL